MTRYFQSFGAGRPIELGGRSFIFEPVEPLGGSWIGVLAVDEESAANILAEAGLEISTEAYEKLKKKVTGEWTPPGFVPSPTPPRLPPQSIVVDAVRAEDRTSFISEKPVPDQSKKNVVLNTTRQRPPLEPLLEQNEPIRRKVA